MLQIFFD